MKLVIVSHVPHKLSGGSIAAYGPYVREMNLWLKHVDEVRLVAPVASGLFDPIDIAYVHRDIDMRAVPAFDITSIGNVLRAVFVLPLILLNLYKAMRWAEHIHIRCPGNMGLLACVVQMLFPGKPKSAKYAGNWDPFAPQPLTHRIQKWILNNVVLTRNMRVMVYGVWPNASRNLTSFFTASYGRDDFSEPVVIRDPAVPLRLIFVGALSVGKQPIVAAQAVKCLKDMGLSSRLAFYGDGKERTSLERYIKDNDIADSVVVHGNVSSAELKEAYRSAHFLVFPSRSEGWPKAVAEAMAWGCVPVTTSVSCVPYMLANGARGALVSAYGPDIARAVKGYLDEPERYRSAASKGVEWSRQFTLERFEAQIVKMLELGVAHE